MLKPPMLPGEFEVACLTDVVHLNSVESITGVVAGQGGGGTQGTTDSFAHASASAQSSPAFWRGSLYLSNYQLSFVVSEGLAAGTHALGFCSSPLPHSLASKASDPLDPSVLAAHPNVDPSNHVLLHVPVGSVFKMDYAKYVAEKGSSAAAAKEKDSSSSNKEKEAKGDYSSFSGDSYLRDLSAAAAAADSTLRDIAYQLTIVCRDARVLSFGILRKASSIAESPSHAHAVAAASTPAPLERQSTMRASDQPSTEDRQASVAEFLRLLKKYAWPREVRKLFAFSYGAGTLGSAKAGSTVPGWQCYDVVREFARQGVGSHPADASLGLSLAYPRRKAAWRLDVTSNARFEFCPSYPQALWLPLDLTDKELGKVKSFRSKSRIPALVFNYSDLLDYAALGLSQQAYPDTVILRSAQPNVGWTFGRCTADERLLELAHVRCIIDARPYANAVANQAKGGGFENAENYRNCRIQFMNIENIHVMRESLNKMLELLRSNAANSYNSGQSSSGDEFWAGLQQSGWLKHVRILLEGAIVCATYVRNGSSILIHCSDGWDRTSQLTSLSQLMLDPFYRTKSGFAILVEKEWVSFGHQWAKRCGHGLKDSIDGTERSPIFFQFLDAVWQIQQQFPFSFEFNAEYLSSIADHIYSNKFGTFLHDNERLRTLDHIKHTTQSLWTEINSEANAHRFRNGLYGKGGVAKPSNAASGSASAAAAGVLGVVPNNPSMNLAALSGADLGRAAFLHVVADPRRIAIWPYWYRWERRKQSHPVQHAAMVPQAHLHHSSAPAVVHFTLAQQARLTALENTVVALEQDAVRMDAALRAHAQQEYDAKVANGEQPSAAEALPASFRRIHINAATKIWEGQFAHGHGHGHAHGHSSNGGKVVPPPPPPQQKKGATGSGASSSGTMPVRKARVGSANNRGSIILTDGRQARGSIMSFGGNPLAASSESTDDFAEGIETEPAAGTAASAAGAGTSSSAASTDSTASSSSSTSAAAPPARLGSGQFPKRVVNPKAKQSSGQVLSGKPLPAASNPRLRQQATLKAQEAKEAMAAMNAPSGGAGATGAAADAATAPTTAAGAVAGPAAAASPPAVPAHGIVHRPRGLSKWNRFTDPASGNPYWHDSITGLTTWNPPSIPEGGSASESASGNGSASTDPTALPVEDFERDDPDAASAAAAAAVRASLQAEAEPAPAAAAVQPAAATVASSAPAATPSAAPAAAAAAPAAVVVDGPLGPQFRISAAAFQGVKLKSTARRFDVAAASIGAPAPAPVPQPAPVPVQPQIPSIPDQLPPPLDDEEYSSQQLQTDGGDEDDERFVSEGEDDLEAEDELLPPAPAAPLLFIAAQSAAGDELEEEVCLPPPPAPPAALVMRKATGSFSSSSNSAAAEEAAELEPLPSPPQPPAQQ